MVTLNDFKSEGVSDCCSATLWNSNNGWGVCSDCKEWAEEISLVDEEDGGQESEKESN